MALTSTGAPRLTWVGHVWLVFLAVAFLLLAVVFPTVYRDRYEHLAASSAPPATGTPTPTSAPPTVGTSSTHPAPTAAQIADYTKHTQTEAAHPGLAVEGQNGYLFLGDVFLQNFAQAMGHRYYSDAELAAQTSAIRNQKAWLASQGIDSEFVVVPAKWSVYGDQLPTWTAGNRLAPIQDQLQQSAPNDIVDIRQALRAARGTAHTYSKLNSHWTDFGALEGFAAISQRIERDYPQIGAIESPKPESVRTEDSNNEFKAITGAPGPNDWTVPVFEQPLNSFVVLKDGKAATVAGGSKLDMLQLPLQTQNAKTRNPHRVLVLADSANTMTSPYWANAFASTMMVRHHADSPADAPNLPALVASYHPDLVVTQISERNLNVVTPDSQTWAAAAAYQNAAAKGGAPLASPPVRVAGSQVSAGVSLTVATTSTPMALQLQLQASAPVTVKLAGTGSSGDFTVPLRLAVGTNTTFALLPAGVSAPVTLSSPSPAVTVTVGSASSRVLSS